MRAVDCTLRLRAVGRVRASRRHPSAPPDHRSSAPAAQRDITPGTVAVSP
ncbi:MAG: hypothetical protein IRY85_06180 [Micromonosporaceae bacterium]|nr:hypothetical protein [Micromonosporaceae bacterium]